MCNNPVKLGMRSNYASLPQRITIPCGHCLGCRLDKQQLWTERCRSEFVRSRSAFVTFTYDEYHLPYNEGALFPTLRRDVFSDYLDNIRHYVKRMPAMPEGCIKDFHYFGVGEYGDSFQRPHYHVLFFGLDFKIFEDYFFKSWKKGMVKSLPITAGGIRYVTDYMCKFVCSENVMVAKYDNYNVERPFFIRSRGLGSDYFFAHADEISKTGCVTSGSRSICVPSYYVNLLSFYNANYKHFNDRVRGQVERYKEICATASRLGFASYDDYVSYTARARELEYSRKLHDKGIANIPFNV